MEQTLLPGSLGMLIFGSVLLFGGLAFFISTAMRAERRRMGKQ